MPDEVDVAHRLNTRDADEYAVVLNSPEDHSSVHLGPQLRHVHVGLMPPVRRYDALIRARREESIVACRRRDSVVGYPRSIAPLRSEGNVTGTFQHFLHKRAAGVIGVEGHAGVLSLVIAPSREWRLRCLLLRAAARMRRAESLVDERAAPVFRAEHVRGAR
ncbi:MAG: hypothetical protein JWM95_1485 [Gemmatimonadetes bacterium]|nr:hypothetical protein [Gemmatimonadota bacterium]